MWCQEELKIRKKQRPKHLLGGSENACYRKRPEHIDHMGTEQSVCLPRPENGLDIEDS